MAAALAAVLPLAFAAPAQATIQDNPDQSQTLMLSSQRNVALMAQTFTAGTTGQLDRVSLATDTPTGFVRANLTIQTVNSKGAPSGSQIGPTIGLSGSVTCCKLFHDYWFQPMIPITGGTQYAIVVQVSAGTLTWYDSGSVNNYAGGREYVGSPWATTNHWNFAFKTWLVSNTAPTIAVDKGAVSVPEGTAPTNSGTCSDPDGDTVSLSASSGTVSKTCTSGAWSWTQPASDETTTTQTVVITADDGQGLTNTAQFTLDVTPVAPTATILTDPLTVPEGSPVPFTGAATTPSSADTASLQLSWTVLKNGSPYSSGSGPAFSFTPDDDGSYLVTFSASDDSGMSDSKSMTVTATNVAPNVSSISFTPSVQLVTTAGETVNFKGTFSDADTADAYTITWNFGDGATATGLTPSHPYAAAGTYTVTFQVSDGEGGVGRATVSVPVQTTQAALGSIAGAVQALPGLNAGQKKSLVAKLNAASAAAGRGDTTAAHNQLNAFLNELQADVNSGNVSSRDAGILRSAVHAVLGSLGTYNRFLEWWPLEA